MNETQRQAYLQVMGIQPYFPRVPVPGAKPSPLYAIDVTSELTPVAAAQAPAPSVISPALLAAAEPGLRFCLNYYRISSTLAVIDEVPFEQAHRVSDSVLILLRAILQALNVNCEASELKPEPFNWPLETSIDVSGDPALAAQQALLGYMAMRQQRDGFRHLLVFAAQLSTLLPEDRQIQGEPVASCDRAAPVGPHSITVTHSLQSLLAHPILKRETWAHLQALRRRLAIAGT